VKNFIDTGAGVIDEDYRGNVGVVLFNHADADFQGEQFRQAVERCRSSFGWSLCAAHPPPPTLSEPDAAPVTAVPAVKKGDRVAQLILERIVTPEVLEMEELDDTQRGAGGYGSTGVAAS
jgi:dUTP pyrophosphatase